MGFVNNHTIDYMFVLKLMISGHNWGRRYKERLLQSFIIFGLIVWGWLHLGSIWSDRDRRCRLIQQRTEHFQSEGGTKRDY